MMLGFSGTLVAVAGQPDGSEAGIILMMLGFSCTLVAFALGAIYGAIRALTSLKRRAALIATSVISATIVLIFVFVLALQPITFVSKSRATIEAGKPLRFWLLVYQNSWAGDLHFSLAPGAPSGMRIDPQRRVFYWTPPLDQPAGEYDVTVLASADRQRAGQTTFVITVTRPTLPGDK